MSSTTSGLLFLTSEDFRLNKDNTKMLCNIRGFSLKLFYSTQCKFCKDLIPIFKKLPGSIGGCQFGMINISHNKQSIILSQKTNTPIREVPYVILYVNGEPYVRYNGPHDPQQITRFIVEAANNYKKQQTVKQNNNNTMINKKSSIPEYTTGKPLCGQDDVCYLEFDEAYTK